MTHPIESSTRTEPVEQLFAELRDRYGLDYSGFARAQLEHRLREAARLEGGLELEAYARRVAQDEGVFSRLQALLSTRADSMFRRPTFFAALREHVVPLLRTYPSARVWVPACSTGLEAYAVAILLREAGIYERTRIYATDADELVLEEARRGVYPSAMLASAARDYQLAGGRSTLDEYVTSEGDFVTMRPVLADRISFAQHHIAAEPSFNEFHLVVCRDVLLQLGPALHARAMSVIDESLARFGVLALGHGETVRGDVDVVSRYRPLVPTERLFRKVVP